MNNRKALHLLTQQKGDNGNGLGNGNNSTAVLKQKINCEPDGKKSPIKDSCINKAAIFITIKNHVNSTDNTNNEDGSTNDEEGHSSEEDSQQGS